ncbi:MAG: DUF2683 family protein [Paludibacteraceae bacterium]
MATAQPAMQTFIISINPNDKRATKLMEALKLMDFLTIKQSPYDPKYVAEVKAMNKRTFKTIKTTNIWK